MTPPQGSKTKQGYELQLGTNTLGHFLFIHFLTPLLKETAKVAPKDSVRIIWVSSMSIDFAPKPLIDFTNLDFHVDEDANSKYNRSKSGNLLHAIEFSRRYPDSGIVSTVCILHTSLYMTSQLTGVACSLSTLVCSRPTCSATLPPDSSSSL
jgi:NAD(P)-dependent dehydrogenase (short-subunit alcohol dehydrogenase family)